MPRPNSRVEIVAAMRRIRVSAAGPRGRTSSRPRWLHDGRTWQTRARPTLQGGHPQLGVDLDWRLSSEGGDGWRGYSPPPSADLLLRLRCGPKVREGVDVSPYSKTRNKVC